MKRSSHLTCVMCLSWVGTLLRWWRREGWRGGWCVPELCFSAEMWPSVQLPGFLIWLWLPSAMCLGSRHFLYAGWRSDLQLSAKSWHNCVWQPQKRLPGLGLRQSFLSLSLPEETLTALQTDFGRWLANYHLKWPPLLLSYCFCLLHFYVVTVHHRTKGVRIGRHSEVIPWP